jgi:hypothetical protein
MSVNSDIQYIYRDNNKINTVLKILINTYKLMYLYVKYQIKDILQALVMYNTDVL